MAVAKCGKNRDALAPLASVYHMLVHRMQCAWGTKDVTRMRQLHGSKAPPGDCLCLIHGTYAHDMWPTNYEFVSRRDPNLGLQYATDAKKHDVSRNSMARNMPVSSGHFLSC